jgi:hypothetical protein
MPGLCRAAAGALAAFALLASPAVSRADVIDGDWCQPGRHFSIKGPEITTPAGHRLQGNYSRHYFTYIVPAPEPDSGAYVAMTLVNENTVHLRKGGDAAAAAQASVEVWVRCAPAVSWGEEAARRG